MKNEEVFYILETSNKQDKKAILDNSNKVEKDKVEETLLAQKNNK